MRAAHLTLLAMALLTLGAPRAEAADPYTARYSKDPSPVFWLMHLSDTHIGATGVEGPDATPHFERALGEIFTAIAPLVVLVTGDLCDGSRGLLPASGQDEAEWLEYRGVIDNAAMTTDLYIDVPGNHDAYDEQSSGQLDHYLTHSLNGSTFGATTRAMVLDLPFGQYLLYGASTANDGSPPFWESPEFSAAEIAELDATLTANTAARLIIAFGHHPIASPDGSGEVIDLLQQHQAFWFHGHSHSHGTYLTQDLLVGQVDTLGKGNSNNIAVIAVDNDALSYEMTDVTDPWPFIVVTAPANRRLHSDEVSPYAYEVCNSATDNPVRALVFDASPVSQVSFAVAGGAAVPMTPDPVEPRLWHGSWDTTGLAAGETTLTVTAVGAQTRERTVSVMLADVTCPPEVIGPDAGVTDAGVADADITPDASPTSGSDAGTLPGPPDEGCSCQSVPAPTTLLPWLLLIGWLWRRRG